MVCRYICQFRRRSLEGKWKPKIKYYDYYAQSQKKGYKVKQIFPYVKVRLRYYGGGFFPDYKAAFLDLHDTGKISHFTNRVFASDGGPGEIQIVMKCFTAFYHEYFAELFYRYIISFQLHLFCLLVDSYYIVITLRPFQSL